MLVLALCLVSMAVISILGICAKAVIMVVLWKRADHYIFALWFRLLSFFLFFPRLISAVAGWMSAILPQTVVALVQI